MNNDSAVCSSSLPLSILITPDGALKMGTCTHCVVEEVGRPVPSWEPDGTELDFRRDTLLHLLAGLGVQVMVEQEYVCP